MARLPANQASDGVSMRRAEAVDTPGTLLASLDDAALVRRARAGVPAAFDELVGRHQKKAVSISYRLLGNLQDALEVCQDAFIRAYRSLDELVDAARFQPWLFRIVTNLSLNYRRSRAARKPGVSLESCILSPDRPREDLVARGGRLSDDADAPESPLLAAELAEAIRAALDELTSAQRTALVLFSMEQMPQKDVAAIMECSVEAVKWHVFQARRRLRERLAPYL